MSVELLEDNTTIASRSLGRTVGGAVVGGVLAGGAGSVVGGLSGNQTMKKKALWKLHRVFRTGEMHGED